MSFLSRTLWIVPLLLHVAYLLATSRGLPELVGARPWDGEAGTSSRLLLVEWLTVVGIANLSLLVLHLWLPRLSDKMLAVPRKEIWLSSLEQRAVLIDRMRGFLETALVLLNVFFLAVYQAIYQAVALRPVLEFPFTALWVGFMAVPIALVAAAFGKLVWELRSGR